MEHGHLINCVDRTSEYKHPADVLPPMENQLPAFARLGEHRPQISRLAGTGVIQPRTDRKEGSHARLQNESQMKNTFYSSNQLVYRVTEKIAHRADRPHF